MNGNDPRNKRNNPVQGGTRPTQRGTPNRVAPRPQRDALDERYEEMVDDRMRAGLSGNARADAINRGKYADLSTFESRGHRRVSPALMRAKRRKQMIRRAIPVCIALLAIIITVWVYVGILRPSSLYNEAVGEFEVGNYNAAREILTDLGDYEDSGLYLSYIEAVFAYDRGEYTVAASAFSELGDFRDSSARASEALDRADPTDENEKAYQAALRLLTSGDYEGARKAFTALGSYSDSAAKAEQARKDGIYAEADKKLLAGDKSGAISLFESLGEYRDAKSRAKAINGNIASEKQERDYQAAKEKLDFKDYQSANVKFLALGDYKDSKKYADYTYGMIMYSSGEYATALECFSACGDFLDSVTRAQDSKYQSALSYYRNGDYERAIALFEELGDYSDSAAQLASATSEYQANRYQSALFAYYDGDLAGALTMFEELGDYSDSASWVTRIKGELVK